ncbi:MAG: hypothetical protein ABIG95_01310 [Candidatus Woesearchaeota archaeon]
MTKRGAVEIQFNWLFVFIIGALILLFFTSFAMKQKKSEETNLDLTILRDIDTIITQAAVSSGTSDVVKLAKPIEFSCEECTKQGCVSTLSIGSGPNRPTTVQPIFSPTLIQDKELLTWSIGWSLPYKATDFLLVSSPDIRYVFVKDPAKDTTNYITKLYSEIPDKFTKETVPAAQLITLSDKNHVMVKFVFYKGTHVELPPSLKSMADSQVSAIVIDKTKPDSGFITFYQKHGNQFQRKGLSPFVTDALAYGAIFSQDRDFYECNLWKTLLRYRLVTEVYAQKVELISQSASGCSYAESFQIFPDILSRTDNILGRTNNLNETLNIREEAIKLQEKNDKLKILSCPLIY